MLQEDKSSLHHQHNYNHIQPQPALPQLQLHLQSHLQPVDQKPQLQLLQQHSSSSEKHGEQKPTDFIMKIFTFLNSEHTDKNLVRWSDTGDSFLIFDSSAFAKTMLPVHFKHGNFSSFVRQLNKYGFRKRGRKMNDVLMAERGDANTSIAGASIEQSASSSNNTISTSTSTTTIPAAAVPECEFYHELFKRGREDLLPDLKRKRKVDNDSKSSSLLKESSTSNDFMDSDDINNSTESLDALKFYKFQQETIQTIQVLSSRVKELTREVAVLKDQMARMSSVSAATTGPVNPAATGMHVGPMIPPGVHHVPFISAPVFPTMQFGGFPSSSDEIQWIRKPKILLVDDDETIRLLGSRILQVFHCGCELASSGSEALQMFNSTRMSGGKYDLILMDIMMPGIDGIETTNRIRAMDQEVPIISMTSNTTEGDLALYWSTGMNDILAKPFTKKYLKVVLRMYLGHLIAKPVYLPQPFP